MPFNVYKKGIRALGVSESFVKGVSRRSVLVGVVMRADNVLDGFSCSMVSVGGIDASQKIFEMYKSLGRNDINLIMLNGCVISWYNVIDLHYLYEETNLPLICVTYKDSEGLEKYFKDLFPEDWQFRVKLYHKNGPRIPLKLHTGYVVFTRFLGMSLKEAKLLLNKFTFYGSIPEPLRIARLIARSIVRDLVIE